MGPLRLFGTTFGMVVVALLIGFRNEMMTGNSELYKNDRGFAVVELFTSEGCSSCPAADELLAQIQKDDTSGQIYILAFHVDYWDHQGWKDTFSEKEFTKRQKQYMNWMNLQTLYTPQIVVNGATEHVGSDKRAVLKAISTSMSQEAAGKLTLHARIDDGRVHVECHEIIADKNSELVVVLIQNSAHVNIKRGENMGRMLSHVQIVRKMNQTSLNVNSKKAVLVLDPPVDFSEKGWELIGFVQNRSSGRITSAGRFDFDSESTSNK